MITVLSTNITSPLGFTTEQNYQAVRAGRSALQRHEGLWGLSEPFAASLFSDEQRKALAIDGFTRFEALAIRSACEALSHIKLDVASHRVILILSTTKGNIGQSPAEAAQQIAKALGVSTTPIVVCNACVSGLSAQLLADRLLSAGLYDYAIVVGAEEQSKFIVSGFQSLKAVSEELCRPFDIERNGLNPGEAAATIVFEAQTPSDSPSKGRTQSKPFAIEGEGLGRGSVWLLANGASRNDAYHLISPSPQGDGLCKAIEQTMEGQESSQLATVCVHGTATLYNDQMEAKAIQRAGLQDIPLTALKGYYGHTMGAAGVLETILTMRATDEGIVLPSKGFTEQGVSVKVNIPVAPLRREKTSFLKILSGFGGCNVAALYTKAPPTPFRGSDCQVSSVKCQFKKTHTIRLSSEDGSSLTDIYKQQIGNYPKFYKMDILTRLAFVAAEQLLSSSDERSGEGAILFNHSSSIVADYKFFAPLRRRRDLSTINDEEDFFPSPTAFAYTLPNMTTGEIAIRHHLTGETSFYILPRKDEALMQQILEATLRITGAGSIIGGWIDAESDTSFECELSIIENKQ